VSAGQLISGAFGTRVGPPVDGTPVGSSSQGSGLADNAALRVESDADRALLVPRQRDRRQGVLDLLSKVTRVLDHEQDVALMRGTFEEALRALVPVRAIQLREIGSRWSGRLEAAPSVESIALEVPGRDQGTRGQLEAAFDPGCRLGEWDFQMLSAATHLGALVLEIERTRTQLARAGLLNNQRPHRDGPAPLIGSTEVMKNLRATIARVASTDFTVLLEGETGVGKELVARRIHECSRRRNGPFVAINCAALVETLLEAELFGIEDRTATGVRGRTGKFEHADGGTLFLDEVSDLSGSAQAKLLRAIQDLSVQRVGGRSTHRLDIRIVAATNQRLTELVERQAFRPDLFYRLSGVDIRVPTLRERTADIMELANYFLDRFRVGRTLRFSSAAADALVTYPWPGNVRELERAMERVVTLTEGDVIALDDLPAPVRGPYSSALGPSLTRNETLRVWACRYARLVVDRCQGNKRAACQALGISYHTLQAYLRAPLVPSFDSRERAEILDIENDESPHPEAAGIQDTS
jgi:DNA-binding NtrC family response regulator